MFAEGRCACGTVRYRLRDVPIVVHCCHCRWCQRETGASFALNAVIETDRVDVVKGRPEHVSTPSHSGRGQEIVRCPSCKVALWSHYGGAGRAAAFIRVGTLDNPDLCPPDVHIFTESRQPWVLLATDAEVFAQFYRGPDVPRIYGPAGAARWAAVRAQLARR